ncbi:MAG: hypothetical protein H0U73_01090 [Tatlockia sp.]|nr:hypothetical protein [Tatlockia sp.]
MKIIRALLIEPVQIQAAIRLNMAKLGWDVDTASDAIIGLGKALTKYFDLILVEISQTQIMDGFLLIDQIKKLAVINKEALLCTITVNNIPENKEKAYKLGVDAFFEGLFLSKTVKEIADFVRDKQSLLGDHNE